MARVRLILVPALALAITGILAARATATLWWDSDGDTAGGSSGASADGIWGTDTFWSTSADGNVATAGWTSGESAVFSAGTDVTGTSTVTLSGTQTVAGVTVEEGKIVFAGSGAVALGTTGTITLNSGTTLSINSSARVSASAGTTKLFLGGSTIEQTNPSGAGTFFDTDTEIVLGAGGGTLSYTTANTLNIVQTASVISGPGSLTKTGAGVLAFANTNTYTGATIINEGELRIRTTANRLPTGTAVTVNSPGILNLNAVAQQIGSLSGNGRVGLAGATLTVGDASDTTFSGVIEVTANAGAGGSTATGGVVTKVGAGTLTLSGANTYTGATNINVGTLALGAAGALPDVSAVTVAAGATLDMNGFSETIGTLAGAGTVSDGGNLTLAGTGSTTFSGSMTVDTFNRTGASGTTTLSGNNTVNNLSIGAGILTLSGANTVSTAVNLNGGRINFNNDNAAGAAPINVGTAAGIEFTNSAPGIMLANNVVLASSANPVTIYSTSGNSLTQTGEISGDRALLRTDTGAGTFTLAGDNTFTGGLTIRSRGLTFGHKNAAGTGTLSLGDPSVAPANAVNIRSNTALTGANAMPNAVSVNRDFSVQGSSDIELSGAVDLGAADRIVTVTNTGATIFSGQVSNGGITKAGAGTLTLTGDNSYGGGTTVNGGTLLVNNTMGSGTGSGAVTVNAGGTLGGTGTIAGPLTFNDGALAPGASPGTLTLSGGGTVVFDPAAILNYELNGADQTVGGGVNDLLTGVGSLTLDGTLNVMETVANSFLSATEGDTWRLINYTGALTNNSLELGTTPALSSGLSFVIDTSTLGQINLVAVPEVSAFLAVGLAGLSSAAIVWIRKKRASAGAA